MFPGDYHLSPPIVSLKVFEDLVLPVKGYGWCCVVGIGLGCLLHMHLYWGTCHTRQGPMGACGKCGFTVPLQQSISHFPIVLGYSIKGQRRGFLGNGFALWAVAYMLTLLCTTAARIDRPHILLVFLYLWFIWCGLSTWTNCWKRSVNNTQTKGSYWLLSCPYSHAPNQILRIRFR